MQSFWEVIITELQGNERVVSNINHISKGQNTCQNDLTTINMNLLNMYLPNGSFLLEIILNTLFQKNVKPNSSLKLLQCSFPQSFAQTMQHPIILHWIILPRVLCFLEISHKLLLCTIWVSMQIEQVLPWQHLQLTIATKSSESRQQNLTSYYHGVTFNSPSNLCYELKKHTTVVTKIICCVAMVKQYCRSPHL